jgi:hypothetical protein
LLLLRLLLLRSIWITHEVSLSKTACGRSQSRAKIILLSILAWKDGLRECGRSCGVHASVVGGSIILIGDSTKVERKTAVGIHYGLRLSLIVNETVRCRSPGELKLIDTALKVTQS